MTEGRSAEKVAIDHVVATFFAAFNNQHKNDVSLENLSEIFVPGCVIVKTCGNRSSIYDFHGFIVPRQKLLNGGGLEEFTENEIWEETNIFGSLALRLCAYRKSGYLHGEKFEVSGIKSFHFARSNSGWRITSVIWGDEGDEGDEGDDAAVPTHPAMLDHA